MPSRDYYESLWEGVPEGLVPAHVHLREAFLLEEVAGARERSERLEPLERSEPLEPSERSEPLEPSERSLRVLDLGCGEGHFAAALAGTGAEVVAVDVATEPLRRALVKHPELDVRFVEAEAPLPLEDSSFDVVWAGETIEHVLDTAQWLSEVRRVLRSGGLLLLTTPDHGPLSRLWMALSRSAFEARFDPLSDHVRFYTRRALTGLLADFGFEEVEVRGASGLPGARRVLLVSGRRRRF